MANTITNTTALIEDIAFTTTKEQSTMNNINTNTTPALVLDNEVSLMDKASAFVGQAVEWTEANVELAAIYTGNNIVGFAAHVEQVVVGLVANAPQVRASAKEVARQRMAAAYAARGITMK